MELAGITPPSMRWDDTTLPEQWEKFMRHTALMFSGPLKAKTEEEKVSYLLLWVGDKGRDIGHTWTDISEDDSKKLDTFYERFKKHVRPTLNPVFARYQFNKEMQGSEAIDSFVTRLRLKSRDCDYHDPEEMIRDRIVFGTNSPKIHEKLINVGRDLTLQKAIQIGQNYEYAQKQMKQMTPNDVHMVKPKTKRRVKRSNRSGTTMGQRQSYGATGYTPRGYKPQTGTNKTRREQDAKCKNCGYDAHKSNEVCPAKGQICRKCNKLNHFQRVCRSKSVHEVKSDQFQSEESDLNLDFYVDTDDHELYKKKLEEMVSLQKKCLSGIAHQRYRMKKMSETSKETGKLAPEDGAIFNELSSKMQKRKDKFRDLEDVLPHKNGIYLSIILGEVNISLLNKEDKYSYKHEYERFKLTVSSIIMGISFFLILASKFTSQRWMDAVLHFLLVWYYCTLTIREHILIVNGSRIKGWWIYHHFISTVCAGITLIWPDGWTYMNFRTQYGIYSLYLACVSVLQYYYQKGSLYRLRALGERHDMDITVEGFMSWMFKGLAFLLPFLFIGYFFQFYNAYVLFRLALHPECKEWQVFALCAIHLILFVGNMFTTLKVLRQKFIQDRQSKTKFRLYKNKYRFQKTKSKIL